jgi:hypothetical protein
MPQEDPTGRMTLLASARRNSFKVMLPVPSVSMDLNKSSIVELWPEADPADACERGVPDRSHEPSVGGFATGLVDGMGTWAVRTNAPGETGVEAELKQSPPPPPQGVEVPAETQLASEPEESLLGRLGGSISTWESYGLTGRGGV